MKIEHHLARRRYLDAARLAESGFRYISRHAVDGDDPAIGHQRIAGFRQLPETGNTLMTYGGIVTVDGVPGDIAETGFCQSRSVEVTPSGEVVFDLHIDGTADNLPLSAFRAEHYPVRV